MSSTDSTVQSLVTLIQAASSDSGKKTTEHFKLSPEQQFSSILSSLRGNPISADTLREVKSDIAKTGGTRVNQWSALLDKAIESFAVNLNNAPRERVDNTLKPEVNNPLPRDSQPTEVESDDNYNKRPVSPRENIYPDKSLAYDRVKLRDVDSAKTGQSYETVAVYPDDDRSPSVKVLSKDQNKYDNVLNPDKHAVTVSQASEAIVSKATISYQPSQNIVKEPQRLGIVEGFVSTTIALQSVDKGKLNNPLKDGVTVSVKGENLQVAGKLVSPEAAQKTTGASQNIKVTASDKPEQYSVLTVRTSSSLSTNTIAVKASELKTGLEKGSKAITLNSESAKNNLGQEVKVVSVKETEQSGQQIKVNEANKQLVPAIPEGVLEGKPKVSTALLGRHIDKTFGEGTAEGSSLKVNVETGEKQSSTGKSDLVAPSAVRAVLSTLAEKNSEGNSGHQVQNQASESENKGQTLKLQVPAEAKTQTVTTKPVSQDFEQQTILQPAKPSSQAQGANQIGATGINPLTGKIASQYNQASQANQGSQNAQGAVASAQASQSAQSKSSFDQQKGHNFNDGQKRTTKLSSADHGKANPRGAIVSARKTDSFASLLTTSTKASQSATVNKFANPLRENPSTASQLHNTLRSSHVAKSSGTQVIRVQLKPAELGSVDIKFSFPKDEAVKVVIATDNKDTMALIEKDRQSILQSLKDCGYQCNDNSLEFSLSQGRQDQTQSQNQNPDNKINNIEQKNVQKETIPETIVTQGQLSHDGSVDVLI